MDRLATFQPHTRALVVANHRTFWDFYVFAWITIWGSRLGRRQFFPVRSTFFYTNPIGGWINALISMMAMFPPILRSKDGKAWNRYAIERLAHELETPGTWVGIHPEGTRNRSSDPFTFLPAQRGAGQIAVGLPGIRVIPVFMHGMSNNPLREIWRNFTAPDQHPIFVCIGEDVEIDDLRAQEPSPELHAAAADRCMAAVARTAEAHRRGPTDLPRARPVRRRAALVEA
jgi:1-acyl-sn-glycerol-3-phosphate acyltransferase